MMKPFLFSWVMLSLWFFAFVWNEYKPFRLNKMFVSLSFGKCTETCRGCCTARGNWR